MVETITPRISGARRIAFDNTPRKSDADSAFRLTALHNRAAWLPSPGAWGKADVQKYTRFRIEPIPIELDQGRQKYLDGEVLDFERYVRI